MRNLFFCFLILNSLALFGQGTYKPVYNPQVFDWLKVAKAFAIPAGDTVLETNDQTPGHLRLRTTDGDSTLYGWIGDHWIRLGSNFDSSNLSMRVDTLAAIIGNDTTTFAPVYDSTLNKYQRVIVAGPDGKLHGYRELIYDSVTGILRIQRLPSAGVFDPGLIVDGAINTNTLKVFVETELFNTLKLPDIASLPLYNTYDTTNNKPLSIDGSGNVKKMGYWPGGGGSGNTKYVLGQYGLVNDSATLNLYKLLVDTASTSGIVSKDRLWNHQAAINTAIGLKVNIADTAAMNANNLVAGRITWPGTIFNTPTIATVSNRHFNLSPTLANQNAYTLFGNNTASSAAPTFFTNNYSDSLKRSSDSVYRRVNGSWVFQYKDSTGGGGSGWGLTGNASTNSGANFVGTTDNHSLRLRTNNTTKIHVDSALLRVGIGTISPLRQLTISDSSNGNTLTGGVLARATDTRTSGTNRFSGWETTINSGEQSGSLLSIAGYSGQPFNNIDGLYLSNRVSGSGLYGTITVSGAERKVMSLINDQVAIGYDHTIQTGTTPTGFGGVATLYGYQTIGSGVAVGYKAQATNYEAIAVGPQARANCLACIALGDGARSTAGVFAGNGSIPSGTYGNQMTFGDATFTNGNLNLMIGSGSGIDHDYAMCLGCWQGSTSYTVSNTTASHQAILGGYDTSSGYFNNGVGLYNSFHLGPVRTSSAAQHAVSVNMPAPAGLNIAGLDLTFNAAIATGNAATGNINFATSTAGSSGTTQQSLANRLIINATGINIPGIGNSNSVSDSMMVITSSGNVRMRTVPTGGGTTNNTTNYYLDTTAGANIIQMAPLSINTQSASYTLVLTDAGKQVQMNVATANNLTVPLNSSVAFPVGTYISLVQMGAGQTTVVATGGVTIRSEYGALKLNVQYSGAGLTKIATDEWVLVGSLTL